MRSVRCDACGAKAMTAAAKCPKCSHLLDLRDGFGVAAVLAADSELHRGLHRPRPLDPDPHEVADA